MFPDQTGRFRVLGGEIRRRLEDDDFACLEPLTNVSSGVPVFLEVDRVSAIARERFERDLHPTPWCNDVVAAEELGKCFLHDHRPNDRLVAREARFRVLFRVLGEDIHFRLDRKNDERAEGAERHQDGLAQTHGVRDHVPIPVLVLDDEAAQKGATFWL